MCCHRSPPASPYPLPPPSSAGEKDLRCVNLSWGLTSYYHLWTRVTPSCNPLQCSVCRVHLLLTLCFAMLLRTAGLSEDTVEQLELVLPVRWGLGGVSAFTCNREKRNHWYSASCWQPLWDSDRSNLATVLACICGGRDFRLAVLARVVESFL